MLNAILLAIILLATCLVLYKIRKVHLMQYDISNDINRQIDNGIKQMESLHSLYMDLKLEKSLPITRGWAASPDFLLQNTVHGRKFN